MNPHSNRNPGTRCIEIPEPSRIGFGFPLPPDALRYLVRPVPGHRFAKPFRDCHGNVVTWNGALGVRIRTFCATESLDLAPDPFEVIDNTIPWPDPDMPYEADRWRLLDEVSRDVWRFQPKAAFIAISDRGGVVGNTFTTIQVGYHVVPLCLLQLAARLPRCRVCIDNQRDYYLRFAWNGGEAVIRPVADLPAPTISIFAPRVPAI